MIKQRGSRWRVVVQAPADPISGKRRQLSGSATSREEAIALERRLTAAVITNTPYNLTVAEAVDEFWATGRRLAPTTVANYKLNLRLHILPVLGARRLDEIRPRLVSQFLMHLRDKGLRPATIRKVRTVLSAVMSFAVAMEYVDSNRVMKVPPPVLDTSPRVAPTTEEAARILLAAEQHDPDFLTFLWVAAEEGGRRGETLALRWGGVDFHARVLTFDATITIGEDGVRLRNRTKTGRPRRVAVSKATLGVLAEHRDRIEALLAAAAGRPMSVSDDDFVFSGGPGSRRTLIDGEPWHPNSATRRFQRLKELAGVRTGVDLHGLRHTMITELLAAGVDPRTVMGRAGHTTEAMTMQVYAKVRPAVDSAAAELWAELLNAKLRAVRAEPGP